MECGVVAAHQLVGNRELRCALHDKALLRLWRRLAAVLCHPSRSAPKSRGKDGTTRANVRVLFKRTTSKQHVPPRPTQHLPAVLSVPDRMCPRFSVANL